MGPRPPAFPRHCHRHQGVALLLALVVVIAQPIHAHQPLPSSTHPLPPHLEVDACHNWFYRNFRDAAEMRDAHPPGPEATGITFQLIQYWGELTECHPINRYACGLGMIYLEGEKVPQDFTQAAEWFRMAAKRGDPAARRYAGVVVWALRAQIRDEPRPRRNRLQHTGVGDSVGDIVGESPADDPLLELALILMKANRLDLLPLLEDMLR